MKTGFNRSKLALMSLLLLMMGSAEAHVKWFAQFDVSKPPLPIGDVLTKTFIWFFLTSIGAIYVFFLVDRYALRKGYLSAVDNKLKINDTEAIDIMRLAAGIFFISLAAFSYFGHVTVLLTPDLVTFNRVVPWIQLAIGLAAFWDRTSPLVGVGIFGLFIMSVVKYGAYHMTDYLIFLGMGYFFLVCSVRRWRWRKTGFVILYKTTGLTLMWAAIEKFGYPEWTYPMLNDNPGMLMGMTPYVYMVLAGFVEFNIAFLMIVSASVLARKIAIGLQAVFILAIFKFGLIDAIGHFMIITILFILFLRGPTDRVRHAIVLRDKAVWIDAGLMTGFYMMAFVLVFIWYYGFHYYYYS
jgi:hypothetical protein